MERKVHVSCSSETAETTFNITCKFLWSPTRRGKTWLRSIMTHAITAYAGARRRSEWRRHEYMCGKFLHNAIARFARVEICLGCWRGRPFLNCTHLGHRRSCSGKRQHDRTPTNIASALESFAATVIMPSAWPDWSKFPFLRSWYLAEIRTPSNYDLPTRRKASALTAWPHVRLTHASTTKSCRCLSSTSGYVKWIIHAKILPRDLWGPVMQGDLWLVK